MYYSEAVFNLPKLGRKLIIWGDDFLTGDLIRRYATFLSIEVDDLSWAPNDAIVSALLSRSLFSGEKLFVIGEKDRGERKDKKGRKDLIQFIQSNTFSSRVVVTMANDPGKTLSKGFDVVRCTPLFPNDLVKLVNLETKGCRFSIHQNLVNFMYEKYYGDTCKILGEVRKLQYLDFPKKVLTVAEVEEYLADAMVEESFGFVSDFVDLKFKKSFRELHVLLKKPSPPFMQILALLSQNLVTMSKITQALNSGDKKSVYSKVSMNPSVLRKKIEVAEKHYMNVDFGAVFGHLGWVQDNLFKTSLVSKEVFFVNSLLTLAFTLLQ